MREAITEFKAMMEHRVATETDRAERCPDWEMSLLAITQIVEDIDYTALLASIETPIVEDKPDAEGWIKHNGGKRPVGRDVRVRQRFTNESTSGDNTGIAGEMLWESITAYKIVEEKKPEKRTYKLSEMYVGWWRVCVTGTICKSNNCYLTIDNARKTLSSDVDGELVAITKADATEFYEGQNLNQED